MTERDPAAAPVANDAFDATLHKGGDRWALTMTREFRHAFDHVWSMLTEPDRVAPWSPVVPDRPLTTVGPATSRETPAEAAVDVTVLRSDPPRELIHRLGDQLLRWDLMPTPAGSRLTLEHTLDESSEDGQHADGWHIRLADLAVLPDGYAVGRVVGGRAEEFAWSKRKDRCHDVLT